MPMYKTSEPFVFQSIFLRLKKSRDWKKRSKFCRDIRVGGNKFLTKILNNVAICPRRDGSVCF